MEMLLSGAFMSPLFVHLPARHQQARLMWMIFREKTHCSWRKLIGLSKNTRAAKTHNNFSVFKDRTKRRDRCCVQGHRVLMVNTTFNKDKDNFSVSTEETKTEQQVVFLFFSPSKRWDYSSMNTWNSQIHNWWRSRWREESSCFNKDFDRRTSFRQKSEKERKSLNCSGIKSTKHLHLLKHLDMHEQLTQMK